jgi:hypothetical protein
MFFIALSAFVHRQSSFAEVPSSIVHRPSSMSLQPPAIALLLALALTACGAEPAPIPATPPAPTAMIFTPMGALPETGQATTLGVIVVDGSSMLFAPAASVTGGGIRALGEPLRLVSAEAVPNGSLVLVRGMLQPAGPNGQRELAAESLVVVVPEETSVGALLDRSGLYNGRLVRVNGGAVISGSSAVLVDQLGDGGIPQPGARQIKLRPAAQDDALLAKLRSSSPAGDQQGPRFGSVQVEGYWRDGALVPLIIRILE